MAGDLGWRSLYDSPEIKDNVFKSGMILSSCKHVSNLKKHWERASRNVVPGNAFLLFEVCGRNAFLFSETGTRQERAPDIKGTRSFLAPHSFFEQILILKFSKKYII